MHGSIRFAAAGKELAHLQNLYGQLEDRYTFRIQERQIPERLKRKR